MINTTIQHKKWSHYLWIYLMIVVCQSNLYYHFLSNYKIILVIICLSIIMLNKKYRDYYSLIFLGIMLLFCILIRYTVGGVGIDVWLSWATPILVTSVCISYNKKLFLNRTIKVIVFIALISIIGFILQLITPNILKMFTIEYNTTFFWRSYSNSIDYITNLYRGYGLFLFSFRDGEMMRNIGIFTEPGIYQMVLNAGLFVLLFFYDKIQISNKKLYKYSLILILAIITCQSTTGYISMLAILIVFLIIKQGNTNKFKQRIFIIIGIVGMILLIDYMMNTSNSFVYKTIDSKLVNNSGEFDIRASTGLYRMGTIEITIKSMIQHPFGIGYDNISNLINAETTGYVAASILKTGAAMGIIPFLIIIFWIFLPILKSNIKNMIKILYIFMYFNTALSQSSEFYSMLILIPLFLRKNSILNESSQF